MSLLKGKVPDLASMGERAGAIADAGLGKTRFGRGKGPQRVGLRLGKRPRLLGMLSLLALFLASVYFYNVITKAPQEVFDIGITGGFATYFVWVLVMFYLYTKQLITTFRLSSGNRKAWKDMMRLCLMYMATSGLSLMMGSWDVSMAFTFQTNALLVMVAMALLALYLSRPRVRLFFTPAYAEPEGMMAWLLFVAGKDPFKSEKLLLI